MARDYKHIRRAAEPRLPGWAWLLTGLAMGLSVALLMYLRPPSGAPEQASARSPQAAEGGTREGKAAGPTSRSNPSRFDFYTLLPELEVVIPEGDAPSLKANAERTAPPNSSAGYILQVGSFQTHREADSRKASLALLGLEADIQTVRVNNDTWHRVRIGPYRDVVQLNQVQERLKAHEIDALLMKTRE
jgi:cell division protein FtsN